MGQTPLEILRKGLSLLKEQIQEKREGILAQLNKGEKISDEDEAWLDQEGNLVDEEALVDRLEKALDYEDGLKKLDATSKPLVERLMKMGRGLKEAAAGAVAAAGPGNKRKRPLERKQPAQKSPKETTPEVVKKENATTRQRVEILDWYHKFSGPKKSQVKTAEHFNKKYPQLKLKQPIISDWLKHEPMWRARLVEEEASMAATSAKRIKQTEHPAVTEMLELWVYKAMRDRVRINGEVLRTKWHQFADLEGIPQDQRLNLSDGWLSSFKQRCGLKEFKTHGEAGSVDPATVAAERERIRELIKRYGYRLKDIFNMDETGLFYGMPPDRGLMDGPTPGFKGCKKRITYALTANADGSEKLPPIVIGKSARPRAFKKKTGEQLGFYYRFNAKAWMNAVVYQEWLLDWDEKLRHQNRHILLLQDNFSGHITPEGLTNIHVENFKPNLTSHVQPNDAGIIRCFKAHYRRKFISRAVDRYDNDVTPAKIYDIDQLEAMRLADQAWHELVDTTTIRNCWRKTGILPEIDTIPSPPSSTPSVPVASLLSAVELPEVAAECEVEAALQDLEDRGVLQRKNRMDLEELLNPLHEDGLGVRAISEEKMMQEIADAVRKRREAAEMIEINGGDDIEGEVEEVDPRPTRQEALAASLLLDRYVAETTDPDARKLEGLLARLRRQLRREYSLSLEPTYITDYFVRK